MTSLDNFKVPLQINHHTGSGQVLVIGDPHFKLDNVKDVQTMESEVNRLLTEVHFDFAVVLGDILHFHERLFTGVLNVAYHFIKMISSHTDVYVLVGNHDYINNSQFLTSNHWMNAMKEWNRVTIVDTVIRVNTSFGDFIFAPYVPPTRFVEALESCSDWSGVTTIFAHQEIRGGKMGAIVSQDGDVWNEECPMVVSGHIHDKQRPQPNVFYTGSAMQHAFGESHNKSITQCKYGQDEIHVTSIKLIIPHKKIIYLDIADIKNFVYDGMCQLRITLTSSMEEFKTFKKTKQYKDLTSKGVKIVFKLRSLDGVPNVDSTVRGFQDILVDLLEPDLMELYSSIL